MKQLYGTPFLTMYGEAPSWIWVQAIDGLTDEQARRGLVQLAKSGAKSYPANLTQFMDAACPKTPGVRYLGVPQTAADRRRLLEGPRPSVEVVDGFLAKIRRVLAAANARGG